MKKPASNSPGESLALVCRSFFPTSETPGDSIQFMPGGVHEITASMDRKPVTVQVMVDRESAAALETQRQAIAARGKRPYFDLNHEDGPASFWPSYFEWRDGPEPGVYARGQWSDSGRAGVEGKDWRQFSPVFHVDSVKAKPAKIVCNPAAKANMGGLVNDPAFQNISPLWAKNGGESAESAEIRAREAEERYASTLRELEALSAKHKEQEATLMAREAFEIKAAVDDAVERGASGSQVITVTSTAGMYPGQFISGAGIPANTFITAVTSATTATMNYLASATATGLTFTLGSGKVPTTYSTYAKAKAQFNMGALGEIGAAFDNNEIPQVDRSIMLNANYYYQLSLDPNFNTFFAAMRSPEIITKGMLPELQGFTPMKAPYFPADNYRVAKLDAYCHRYNAERQHGRLEGLSPLEAYKTWFNYNDPVVRLDGATRYLLLNHRCERPVGRNGVSISWAGNTEHYCSEATGRLKGQRVLVWYDLQEDSNDPPASVTLTDLHRRNPVEIPLFQRVPSYTATPGQMKIATVQAAAHGKHQRTVYRAIAPLFKQSMFRTVQADVSTAVLGDAIEAGRGKVRAKHDEQKQISQRTAALERERGLATTKPGRDAESRLLSLELAKLADELDSREENKR